MDETENDFHLMSLSELVAQRIHHDDDSLLLYDLIFEKLNASNLSEISVLLESHRVGCVSDAIRLLYDSGLDATEVYDRIDLTFNLKNDGITIKALRLIEEGNIETLQSTKRMLGFANSNDTSTKVVFSRWLLWRSPKQLEDIRNKSIELCQDRLELIEVLVKFKLKEISLKRFFGRVEVIDKDIHDEYCSLAESGLERVQKFFT